MSCFWAGQPLIRLPPPTGVEPRVSTRPSDPRLRGEGDMPQALRPPLTSRRARPLATFTGRVGRGDRLEADVGRRFPFPSTL
ncbi:hypothetical protein GFL96_35765 [Rhizobium leguminosarum bv. viciae]|nr:hypothetical protein [Rhizobium leguminosarum bv. viciae]